MGGARLHLKIDLVVGAPALPKSDLEAGLEEADVDQVDLRTEGGGGGERGPPRAREQNPLSQRTSRVWRRRGGSMDVLNSWYNRLLFSY